METIKTVAIYAVLGIIMGVILAAWGLPTIIAAACGVYIFKNI